MVVLEEHLFGSYGDILAVFSGSHTTTTSVPNATISVPGAIIIMVERETGLRAACPVSLLHHSKNIEIGKGMMLSTYLIFYVHIIDRFTFAYIKQRQLCLFLDIGFSLDRYVLFMQGRVCISYGLDYFMPSSVQYDFFCKKFKETSSSSKSKTNNKSYCKVELITTKRSRINLLHRSSNKIRGKR